MDDAEIRALIARLARSHSSGGQVIERAGILAEGADGAVVVDWIIAHGGEPEALATAANGGGLHDARPQGSRNVLRYVLPPGALS